MSPNETILPPTCCSGKKKSKAQSLVRTLRPKRFRKNAAAIQSTPALHVALSARKQLTERQRCRARSLCAGAVTVVSSRNRLQKLRSRIPQIEDASAHAVQLQVSSRDLELGRKLEALIKKKLAAPAETSILVSSGTEASSCRSSDNTSVRAQLLGSTVSISGWLPFSIELLDLKVDLIISSTKSKLSEAPKKQPATKWSPTPQQHAACSSSSTHTIH